MFILLWILGMLAWCALVFLLTAENSPMHRLITRCLGRV